MLDTHSVTLPPAHQRDPGLIPGQRDMTATAVLQLMKPALLDNHVPLKVFGDGNCLYRALSRALYGTEEYHMLLRLFTALEILCHDKLYDPQHPEMAQMIGDRRIDLPSYNDTCKAVLKPGEDQDIVHMYAASAVINMPIVSHHPSSSELLTAWSRRVVGRGVKDMATDVRLLWSSGSVPDTAATFTANHFGTGKRRRLRTQELATSAVC